MRNGLLVLGGYLSTLCFASQISLAGSDQPSVLRQVAVSEAALSLGLFEHTPYPKLPEPSPIASDRRLRGDVTEREKTYTIEWLRKLLRDGFVPGIENLHCLTGLPPRSDDAVASVWSKGRYRLQLVDSRVLCLTFSVLQEDIGKTEAVFREAFCFDHGNPSYVTVKCNVLRHIGPQESFGEVRIARPSGWIAPPVLWYRTLDSVTFVLRKEIAYPVAKGGPPLDVASEFVGGCAPDLPDSFLRFSHSNRKALAVARLLELHALRMREMQQQILDSDGSAGKVRRADEFR